MTQLSIQKSTLSKAAGGTFCNLSWLLAVNNRQISPEFQSFSLNFNDPLVLEHKSETVTFNMCRAGGIILEAAVGVGQAITSAQLHPDLAGNIQGDTSPSSFLHRLCTGAD